jgi:hypothetical protein
MVELKEGTIVDGTLPGIVSPDLQSDLIMQDEPEEVTLAGKEIAGNVFANQTESFAALEPDSQTQTAFVNLPEQIFLPADHKVDHKDEGHKNIHSHRRSWNKKESMLKIDKYKREKHDREKLQKEERKNKNGKSEVLPDSD